MKINVYSQQPLEYTTEYYKNTLYSAVTHRNILRIYIEYMFSVYSEIYIRIYIYYIEYIYSM